MPASSRFPDSASENRPPRHPLSASRAYRTAAKQMRPLRHVGNENRALQLRCMRACVRMPRPEIVSGADLRMRVQGNRRGRGTCPMYHRVRPRLESHQDQGQNRHCNLQLLISLFLRGQLPPAPLCGRTRPQMPNPGQHRQVHYRSHRGQNQHGNPNGVLMKTLCRCVDSACRCQGRQSNRHANAADGQHCRA